MMPIFISITKIQNYALEKKKEMSRERFQEVVALRLERLPGVET